MTSTTTTLIDRQGLQLVVLPHRVRHKEVEKIVEHQPERILCLGADPISNKKIWDKAVDSLPLAGPDAHVWEVEAVGDDDCPDDPRGLEVAYLGRCDAGMPGLARLLQERNRTTYMNGDCWDFALAIHRHTGWSIAGIYNEDGDLSHVMACHPGGVYLDVRGAHEGGEALNSIAGGAFSSIEPVAWDRFEQASGRPVTMAEEDGRLVPAWQEEWRDGWLTRTEAIVATLYPDVMMGPAPRFAPDHLGATIGEAPVDEQGDNIAARVFEAVMKADAKPDEPSPSPSP